MKIVLKDRKRTYQKNGELHDCFGQSNWVPLVPFWTTEMGLFLDFDTAGEPSGHAQIERDFVNGISTKIGFASSIDFGE